MDVSCIVNSFYYTSVSHRLSFLEHLLSYLRSPFPCRSDPTFPSIWSHHYPTCPRPALLPRRRYRPMHHAASRTPTSKRPPSAQQHHLTLPRRQPTTRALTRPHYHDGSVLHLSFPTTESRHGQRPEQTQLLVTIIVSLTGGPPLLALAMNRELSRRP